MDSFTIQVYGMPSRSLGARAPRPNLTGEAPTGPRADQRGEADILGLRMKAGGTIGNGGERIA